MESAAAVKGGEASTSGGSCGSHGRGWRHHAVSIWNRGGLRAFYAGITAEYMKVVPGMIVAFTTFEFLKQALGVKQDCAKATNMQQLKSTPRNLEEQELTLSAVEIEVVELLMTTADES